MPPKQPASGRVPPNVARVHAYVPGKPIEEVGVPGGAPKLLAGVPQHILPSARHDDAGARLAQGLADAEAQAGPSPGHQRQLPIQAKHVTAHFHSPEMIVKAARMYPRAKAMPACQGAAQVICGVWSGMMTPS